MKIFMLVSRVPWPLEKGDKLRAYYQLKELSKRNEVFLCCLSDGKTHPDAILELQKYCVHLKIIRLNRFLIVLRLIVSLFGKKPFQVNYFYQSWALRKIHRTITSFHPDHIFCQLVRTSEYVKHLHEYKKTIDYMDALSAGQRRRMESAPLWMRPFVKEEAKRLTQYENLIFDYFDYHTIISEQDKHLIYHERQEKIVVIPNGVNHEYFTPKAQAKKYDLIFTGNMSYPPNVDCVLRIVNEVLPLVLGKYPSTSLLIAGASPVRAVLQLVSEKIHVSGWIDDIRDAYSQSLVFIAPMRMGSGLQNKLLEAMSMELPCISTSLAATPIQASHDENILIADSNERIAEYIIELLTDKEKAKRIAFNGRQFVIRNFNWSTTVSALEKLFSE